MSTGSDWFYLVLQISWVKLTQVVSKCCGSSARLPVAHHPVHPAARNALRPGCSPVMHAVHVSVLKRVRWTPDRRNKLKSCIHSFIGHRFAHSIPWCFPSAHFPRFMWDARSRNTSHASPFLFSCVSAGSGRIPESGLCAAFGWSGALVLQVEPVELIDELLAVQQVMLRFPCVLFAPVAFPSD